MKKIVKIGIIFALSIIALNKHANASVFNLKFNLPKDSPQDIRSDIDFSKMANKSAELFIDRNDGADISDAQGLVETQGNVKILKTFTVRATAYSSTVDQTDSSPFITASGTYVRDGIIAANFLPFGTVVRIPDIYGGKLFVVEDRMHERYWYNIDIWFPDRSMAKEFGARKIKIEVVSNEPI